MIPIHLPDQGIYFEIRGTKLFISHNDKSKMKHVQVIEPELYRAIEQRMPLSDVRVKIQEQVMKKPVPDAPTILRPKDEDPGYFVGRRVGKMEIVAQRQGKYVLKCDCGHTSSYTFERLQRSFPHSCKACAKRDSSMGFSSKEAAMIASYEMKMRGDDSSELDAAIEAGEFDEVKSKEKFEVEERRLEDLLDEI